MFFSTLTAGAAYIWKQWTFILSNLDNFHSLEVVDRVSETQLQVKIQIE